MRNVRRFFTRRPRPAAIITAGLATVILGTAAALGATPGTDTTAAPAPRPSVSATATEEPLVTAYNAGWKAGVAALGDSKVPTYSNAVGDGSDPGTVAWHDGWVDGQADALGVPDECRGEIEYAELCATVAAREAYAYTDTDGVTHAVPSGREQLARLDATPGTDAFAAALFELDTQWVQRNEP
ncbi:hypothetical protein [Streptomyces griseomycini]|uniref:Secreted protein n=1 Tax=Streptomyces griseomycini TaxID=66895 RepID=A0A7W7PWD8_9ACTN|nr:hypothetical protein [Streptomyces griseomycini]MBB4902586.1 hypothetical protein [Streptomyces griseomycini]GGR54320.1 hypothetical protein GCM10015536_69570 [Streptomyces griseomycini]